jgi:hypothetical protein
MKANIIVNFKRIKFTTIDEKLLKEVPQLVEETRKTTMKLCKQIDKYFSDNHIKTESTFKLEDTYEND